LIAVARRAFGANREEEAFDSQGRVWAFIPGVKDGRTGLTINATFRQFDLGVNFMPSDQLQCDAGDQLLRSAIAILAGSIRP
jgi:hypothetical protein